MTYVLKRKIMPSEFNVLPRTVYQCFILCTQSINAFFFFLKPDLDHSLELGLGEKHSVYDELINYQKSNALQSGALCLKASTRNRGLVRSTGMHGQTGTPRGLSFSVA